MKVILIVGRIRAGKDTVAAELKKMLQPQRVHQLSFSDAIGSVLGIFDVPHERRYLNECAAALKSMSFGVDIFNRAVAKKLRELDEGGADIVLLCGARFINNLEVLRGYRHFTIGVDAQLMVRYLRATKLEKDGELSLEQFQAAELAPTEGNIDELMRRASIVIENNRSVGELSTKLWGVSRRILAL